MRFYGLDPERVPEIPTYLLRPLLLYLPALQAEEQHRAITAALTPYVDVHDRRDLINALERSTAPLRPTPPQQVGFIEYNPEKAKAYFDSIGAITS